jgi:hypothetical protein
MRKGFPYHSVSVIHRPQDVGLHVYIMKSAEHLIDEEVKDTIEAFDFTYRIVNN